MAHETGQLIEHPKWGRGKIVAVNGDKVRVIFKNAPEAKLIDTALFPLPLASDQGDAYFARIQMPSAKGKSAVRVKSRLSQAEAKQKFLARFPLGFRDPRYDTAERGYKLAAHQRWAAELDRATMERMLAAGEFTEIAQRAMQIEAGTNLLDVFAKAAMRNGVAAAPEAFARALFDYLYGEGEPADRFEQFATMLDAMPHPKTNTFKWPIQTIFPYLADPGRQMFMKPKVTQLAADRLNFSLGYRTQPAWDVYARLLQFADALKTDLAELHPADYIDVQSFIWVSGQMEEDKYEKKPAKAEKKADTKIRPEEL